MSTLKVKFINKIPIMILDKIAKMIEENKIICV